jgi:hypothetical protein
LQVFVREYHGYRRLRPMQASSVVAKRLGERRWSLLARDAAASSAFPSVAGTRAGLGFRRSAADRVAPTVAAQPPVPVSVWRSSKSRSGTSRRPLPAPTAAPESGGDCSNQLRPATSSAVSASLRSLASA